VRAAIESDQQLEWRLDKGGLLAFATLDELREEGFTHYVIAPIRYASGSINAFSWATKQPGGFTPAEMALCEELLPALSAVIEAKALRRFTENMLQTYVGREPTRLILDGQVRRGDIRTITAALMLVDLRDFTLISDGLAPRAVIRLLNEYFDCVFPAVRRHGGEIMEIMGDGVLAIFHQEEISAAASCREALAAARESLAAVTAFNMRGRAGRQNGNGNVPPMQVGIALHYGTVSYGNIGSGDRLDFTVIGPDVNLTSRIERFCRELDRTLIMSEIFVDTLGQEKLAEPMWELGYFQLRGFNRMQRLFALPSEER
jgi:adenylate cyclase